MISFYAARPWFVAVPSPGGRCRWVNPSERSLSRTGLLGGHSRILVRGAAGRAGHMVPKYRVHQVGLGWEYSSALAPS